MLEAAHLGFKKDTEIMLGSGVGSFGGGTKRFEFLMTVGSSDDLGDQPGEFLDGHVLDESMVVNPVRAHMGVFEDGWIF